MVWLLRSKRKSTRRTECASTPSTSRPSNCNGPEATHLDRHESRSEEDTLNEIILSAPKKKDNVRLSFDGAYDALDPMVVLYNPGIMPFALFTQVQRFGLIGGRQTRLAGTLKGTRRALVEVIKSYGYEVDLVHPEA